MYHGELLVNVYFTVLLHTNYPREPELFFKIWIVFVKALLLLLQSLVLSLPSLCVRVFLSSLLSNDAGETVSTKTTSITDIHILHKKMQARMQEGTHLPTRYLYRLRPNFHCRRTPIAKWCWFLCGYPFLNSRIFRFVERVVLVSCLAAQSSNMRWRSKMV